MSEPPIAVYDACVLYSAPMRDLLMSLAESGVVRARWTNAIHEEWTRSIISTRPNISMEQLDRIRMLMDQHVPDCLVQGYEQIIDTLSLPDADDRHVLAAAIRAGATAIITLNLKDFPVELLAPYHIAPLHPDQFISQLLHAFPAEVCRAIAAHRQRLRKPAKNVDQYLETLLRQGLNATVEQLRKYADSL